MGRGGLKKEAESRRDLESSEIVVPRDRDTEIEIYVRGLACAGT